MDFKIEISDFLAKAVQDAGISNPIPLAVCTSESCSGQGCIECETGGCESGGCQSCMCVYQTGQDPGCGEGCSEGCTYCQSGSCQDNCMLNCQCLNCEGFCQTACEVLGQCGTACEITCLGCQTCQSCEVCETSEGGEIPSYSISYTHNQVTIYITRENYTYFRIYLRVSTETDAIQRDVTSSTYTWPGLSPETTYVINVGYSNDGVVFHNIGAKTFTTDPEPIEIDPWNWHASNGSASASMTEAAFQAVTKANPGVSKFNHVVWNDLVDKVMEMRTAKGRPWMTGSSSPLTYAATKMTASDRTLTADRFNSLKYQVGSILSTGISDVSPNEPVMGWYFTTLTDKLNEIITS